MGVASVRGSNWKFAVCAAALAGAVPAQAASPAPSLAASLSVSAESGAVASFYAMRQGAPIWFRTGGDIAAPERLVAILRRASVDGLTIAPQLAGDVEAAITAARSGEPAAVADADRLLSTAWVVYVQKLRSPTAGMIYGDPAVRSTAPRADQILRDAASAASLSLHLDQVSAVNPLYSALREAALMDTTLAAGPAASRIAANLDRVRALPAEGRFVVIDAAAARLWMYEDGKPVDSMKVIVGTRDTPTPMIASMIHYTTLNPYWHVPDNLARKTIAPNVIKQGKNYLKTRGYQIVSAWSNDAQILSPDEVDWKAVAAGRAEVKVRQLPGGGNSMGKMKFAFANGEGIFLHDTPNKALFAKAQRTLSNGCIRLEDAPRLARWLMGSAPQTSSTLPDQHLQLPRSMPVFVTYITAHPSGGRVTFTDDVYGLDAPSKARVAELR